MSRENVEVVRRIVEAFSREDPEEALAGIASDVRWRAVEDPETQHGHQGVVKSVTGWLGVWDEHRLEAEEFIEAGDHVLVVAHFWARGRGSGAQIDERYFQVWTVRDGKVVAFREYRDKAQALNAVGLRE